MARSSRLSSRERFAVLDPDTDIRHWGTRLSIWEFRPICESRSREFKNLRRRTDGPVGCLWCLSMEPGSVI